MTEIIPNFEEKLYAGELKCAKCGGTIIQSGIIMWD